MPELPEVEHARRLAERVARGRVIEHVTCARDPIVYESVGPARFGRALRGRRVRAVRRRGKHLWLELDDRPWPCFHFGMTGAFRVPDAPALRLASSPGQEPATWPPRFCKIRLRFDDGGELAMVNKRRLGRIRLRADPPGEPPIGCLGFDPLLDLPAPDAFAALVARRTGNVKGLLLDQTFAAGVGNWIADEVLYQARIDPRRSADTLSAAEARALRRTLARVVRRAVAANGDKQRFPRAWLFHRRWGKRADAVTADGHPIEHLTIAGRTTAWVPRIQS
ncbi:MAG: DNA-formamidopyrimidine glycosylase family protein [Planctomycetota bacterium]|jgi:formamidopyrimidine-DNA glycosylase